MYDDELMLCYLKEIIVLILAVRLQRRHTPVTSSPMQERFESELLNEIVQYINAHIYEQFTIEEILPSVFHIALFPADIVQEQSEDSA